METRINGSTCKALVSCMVAVKVPTANGGHNKYNTKAGMFKAITPILLEWFQPALVAQCHQGTFFKDVDIWQMDAWHNKFWMAHMCIPQIFILPQTSV